MNAILNSFYIPINYVRAKISSLTPQQKNIALIASIAFGFLAIYYVFRQCYCFKATIPDDDQNDDQLGSSSISLYTPDNFNRPPLISKGAGRSFPLFLLNSIRAQNKTAPLYSIQIDILDKILPATRFEILDYNVNNEIVEFLIQCQASNDPEVQALWDEETQKLYIVGGKNESQDGHIAPNHSFWIRMDLRELDKKGIIPIYAMLPETKIIAGPYHREIGREIRQDVHLFSVTKPAHPYLI